jgi:hypothetical protein
MAIEYNNSENNYDKNALAKTLEKHLTSCGLHTVAIFGRGHFCEWLLEILALTEIRVKFMADHTLLEDTVTPHSLKNRIRRFLKYRIKCTTQHGVEPVSLYVFDKWPKVDAVIVAPYAKYDFFRKKIEGKTKAQIVSITQLAD